MKRSVVTALDEAAPHYYEFYRQAAEGAKSMNGDGRFEWRLVTA